MNLDAIVALLMIFGAFLLFYGPWQEICTDLARQIMFEKRDTLFDMAQQDLLDFRSTEYRTIRTSIEKSIRFAHELTLPRFVLLFWYLRRMNLKRGQSEVFYAVREIKDSEIRKKVERLVADTHLTLIMMAMAKSPITVLVFLILLPIFGLQRESRIWAADRFKPLSEAVQMEAEFAA